MWSESQPQKILNTEEIIPAKENIRAAVIFDSPWSTIKRALCTKVMYTATTAVAASKTKAQN